MSNTFVVDRLGSRYVRPEKRVLEAAEEGEVYTSHDPKLLTLWNNSFREGLPESSIDTKEPLRFEDALAVRLLFNGYSLRVEAAKALLSLSAEGYPVLGFKYNPYHDSLGRFAKAGAGGTVHGLSKEDQDYTLRNWFGGDTEEMQRASRKIITTDKVGRNFDQKQAAFTLEGIEKGAVQPELHRGMRLKPKVLDALQPGSEFVMPLSSFSKKPKIATEFSQPFSGPDPGRKAVVLSVRNVKGFDMETVRGYKSGPFAKQREVVLAGKYQITGRYEKGDTTYIELGLQG